MTDTDITLHGWTVDTTPGEGFVIVSTLIPFSDGDDGLHFFNAAGSTMPAALRSLADQLGAAVKVMIWLCSPEDRTYDRVHDFVLHINEAAFEIEKATLEGYVRAAA